MTTHALIQYLKYRWKARNRHGTHSPFVYDLLENVLYTDITAMGLPLSHGVPDRYEALIDRLVVYEDYSNIVSLSPKTYLSAIDVPRAIFILGNEPGLWKELVEKVLGIAGREISFIVPNIHKTKAHTRAWQQLCATREVLMSIDIYGIGLLLSRQEFREKQHFVLKY